MRLPRGAPRSRRQGGRTAACLLAAGLVALVAVALTPTASDAAGGQQEIASDGPLTRIIVSGDLNCQVAHRADSAFEFFGDELGACGTFVATNGTLYGPAFVPAGGMLGALTPWTPVRQEPATGSGSSGDPLRIVTVAEGGADGLRVEQTDSYVIGEESYRTDIRIEAIAGDRDVVVYRAADCYLQNSDTGVGRVDDGAPACVISFEPDARIEQWLPLTPGSTYAVGSYAQVWSLVATQQPFDDRCDCDTPVDNGAGLSWRATVPNGESVTISHLTFFSPEGRVAAGAAGVRFSGSVPGPADITLDPIVLATSAILAAGVVFLVPFPSALFNSTLEQNYDEVTGGARRMSGWLSRSGRGLALAAWRRIRPPPPATTGPPVALAADLPETDAGAASGEFWKSPLGALAFVGISAFVYSLLDPTFGLSLESLATFAGMALGLVLTLATVRIPIWIASRRAGLGVQVTALPGTIAIAIACVIVSRIAEFQPGYLYGLILGFALSQPISRTGLGRIEGIGAGVGLAAAVVGWLLLPGVRAGDQPILETALATLVVAGLEGALFAMMPIRFLPGERVRAWNPRAWMAILGLAAFAFFHILLNPTSGYLAEAERGSMVTVIGLLAAFGLGSVLFWAYFRFRPARPPRGTVAAEPVAPEEEIG